MFYGDCITDSRIAPSERYFRSRDFKRALLEKKVAEGTNKMAVQKRRIREERKKKGFQLRLNGKCGE